MRVLHVMDKMNPKRGGVCQAVRNIIKGLGFLEVHSEVVCLDAPNEPFLNLDPFITHALGPADNPWSHSPKLIPWLQSNVGSFEVVILHGLWQYPGYAVFKAVRKLKKNVANSTKQPPRFFVMPHGMLDPYFQKAPERKLKAVRNVVYWKLIEKKIVNTADGLLFTCAEEAQLAKQPFRPYRPKKELVVGLGVDEPPVFEDTMQQAFLQHCPEVRDSSYLLILSRIHEKKGVDLLLNAYLKLSTDHHEKTVLLSEKLIVVPKLVIAGPGLETAYGQQLQKHVSRNDFLNRNVFFTDMLTGPVKWGAFYCCDAFILPSHQENFGIAVVEALACGKPVLISDQVNIWREIIQAKAGFVAADTLAGTLKLMQDWQKLTQEQQLKMGENGRTAFEKHFTIDRAAHNLLKAIS